VRDFTLSGRDRAPPIQGYEGHDIEVEIPRPATRRAQKEPSEIQKKLHHSFIKNPTTKDEYEGGRKRSKGGGGEGFVMWVHSSWRLYEGGRKGRGGMICGG